MGRPPKDLSRSGLWQEQAVADFLCRHPQGMYRPVDIDADPEPRIEAMPWWENRPALILVGCSDARWNESRLIIWARALAEAAEARAAVVEIACGAAGAHAEVDFGELEARFRWRSRPETALGPIVRLRRPGLEGRATPSYFHLVRTPGEHDRPPPLTVPEMISSLG